MEFWERGDAAKLATITVANTVERRYN